MMQLKHTILGPPPQSQPPPGLRLFASPHRTRKFHQFLVLSLTFIAYASFHASRKPPSIVKSILTKPQNGTGWAPFDGPRGPHRLGELDLSFLLSYAIGMYFAGHIGDTVDLRLFLTVGMMGSGIFVTLFGLGYFLDLHSFGAFVFIQILCGLFQSIGWPCVVAVVGNWFGKEKRGLIMGAWSSHTSVGNILGSIIASSILGFGWGWSFVLPGILIMIIAVFVYLFLVVHPENVGFDSSERDSENETSVEGIALGDSGRSERGAEGVELVDSDRSDKSGEEVASDRSDKSGEEVALVDSDTSGTVDAGMIEGSTAIGFLNAWRLPNVASYALCLFFSKLVAYTFLYWLPFYISHTAVAGKHLSHKTAGILSTIFDIGGVCGGISAGVISDAIEARGITSITFLFLSIPTLILYRVYGSISTLTNILLMFASGFLVNGPYSLITTAVAADLGSQGAIRGSSRALATVSAIIDGTGSVGAALGPLLAGYISTRGWNNVFCMLIVSILIAGVLLICVVKKEIEGKMGRWLAFTTFFGRR